MCSSLYNWLPVNMSVVLYGAECGIDLVFVMMVSNQVKPLSRGSFHLYVRLLPRSSKRLVSNEIIPEDVFYGGSISVNSTV